MSTDQAKKNILRIVPEGSHGSQPSEAGTLTASQIAEGDPVCPLCFGTGMEVVPGKGARRCQCRKRNTREMLLKAARIPDRYRHCSLATYDAGNHEHSKWRAKQEVQELI